MPQDIDEETYDVADNYDVVQIAQTGAPEATILPDGSPAALMTDRHGSTLSRYLGGRFYSAASRGNLFIASTPVAGVTLPVPPINTVMTSTAGIINPTGSTVNIELVALGIGTITFPDSLKPFVLGFMFNYSGYGATGSETSNVTGAKVSGVTSIVKLPSYNMPLSSAGNAPLGIPYSSAVFNTGTVSTDKYGPLSMLTPVRGGEFMTSAGYAQTYFKFDGEIMLGPDTGMALVHLVATLANVNVTYVWAEWPI